MNYILIANLINAVGVILLIYGHYKISKEHNKNGFIISGLGSLFVSAGSFLLGSIPIVFLNLIWFFISINGFLSNDKKSGDFKNRNGYIFIFLVAFVLIFSAFLTIEKQFDHLAWFTTSIYVVFYFLFANKQINLEKYLFICMIGFLILIPHLILHFSYAVLINEIIGFIISLNYFIIKYRKRRALTTM